MHDEASPYYVEMIDQTTRGHQFLKANFGDAAIPRGTWQIDPFGHSNTEAWLLGAEAGFESLYWVRSQAISGGISGLIFGHLGALILGVLARGGRTTRMLRSARAMPAKTTTSGWSGSLFLFSFAVFLALSADLR